MTSFSCKLEKWNIGFYYTYSSSVMLVGKDGMDNWKLLFPLFPCQSTFTPEDPPSLGDKCIPLTLVEARFHSYSGFWLWLDALPSDLSSSSSWFLCLFFLRLSPDPNLSPAYIVAALTRRHGQLPMDYGKPTCSENFYLTSSCSSSYSVSIPTVVGANSWRTPELVLSWYTIDVLHWALNDTDLATLQIESWGPL